MGIKHLQVLGWSSRYIDFHANGSSTHILVHPKPRAADLTERLQCSATMASLLFSARAGGGNGLELECEGPNPGNATHETRPH